MLGAFLVAISSLPGCGSSKKPRARKPDRIIVRDTPEVLRNTVLAQSTLQGTDPFLVSGYGLVVGLNNTGGGDVPGAIRAVMQREMLIMGVGKEIGPFRDLNPDDIMNDKRTAVVIVSAAVPPGATIGTRFDVRVDVVPGSATTSLEGGRLYTTRLFKGMIRPAAPATEPVAEAKGEMFINPFADPAKSGIDGTQRTAGRVLNGGGALRPVPILLTLDAPSHTRVRAMADSINSRFPRERGDRQVATGRNEETIEINIPTKHANDADQFLNLLRRVRVDQTFPEEAALRYVRALKEQPELSEELSWCIEALGPVAVPHLRDMYTHSEDRPRLAAITAGAKLGDMLARPHLEELAISGPPAMRASSLKLLAQLGPDPKINEFLRDRLSAGELDIRLAAYEALDLRADPWIQHRRVDRKFRVDLVPSPEPMVYVTMQREPRVVLFGGEDLSVRRPVFVSVWDDRLMLSADSENDPVRVFYRDYRTDRSTTAEVRPQVADLVEYLAHQTTPEEPAPGLDMNYSQVVGALSVMLKKGASSAAFVPETDRLELDLLRLRQDEMGSDRPELAEAEPDAAAEDGVAGSPAAATFDRPETPTSTLPQPSPTTEAAAMPAKKKYVVPLSTPKAAEQSRRSPGE